MTTGNTWPGKSSALNQGSQLGIAWSCLIHPAMVAFMIHCTLKGPWLLYSLMLRSKSICLAHSNPTSHDGRTSIGGSFSSESRPEITEAGGRLQNSTWTSNENGVSHLLNLQKSAACIDRSITKFPGILLRSRVAAGVATVLQTLTAADFVVRRWVCRKK